MNTISKTIQEMGVVPVVVLNDAKDAKPLAQALCEGGLPCAEVTFRTEAAEESIRLMTECYPDMFVGAGTVLTTEQVDRAVNAGAKFIVSLNSTYDNILITASKPNLTIINCKIFPFTIYRVICPHFYYFISRFKLQCLLIIYIIILYTFFFSSSHRSCCIHNNSLKI